jgi:hypothetical protein
MTYLIGVVIIFIIFVIGVCGFDDKGDGRR